MHPNTLHLVFAFLFLASLANATPEKQVVDGVTYHILSTPADTVRIIWQDATGKQVRTFPEAARHVRSQGLEVETVMNGGIFEPGGIPSGLLVQDGKELRPVNRKDGKGNFHLKPNGIFMIGPQGAAVIRTDEYPIAKAEVRQAVQSGPLLLRKGQVHPAFNAGSGSRLHRNGVGIAKDGRVVFAMTDANSAKFPNLHEFARLFLALGCDDALFLDGDLSQMQSGNGIDTSTNRFGSIIVVTKSLPSAQSQGQANSQQPATPPRN